MRNRNTSIQEILLIAAAKTAHSAAVCRGNWPQDAYTQLCECKLPKSITDQFTCCYEWPISISIAAQKALNHYNILLKQSTPPLSPTSKDTSNHSTHSSNTSSLPEEVHS